jgi:hypothetical protein
MKSREMTANSRGLRLVSGRDEVERKRGREKSGKEKWLGERSDVR